MENNLIFDFGFLNGEDTRNYMSKSFNVIALEANPILCEKAKLYFKKEIESKQLIILNNAFSSDVSSSIKFYINETRPEVSSTERWIAEQEGQYKVKEVDVRTINLSEVILKFGTPHYMKVDIEGVDKDVSKQLIDIKNKPSYVSFELNKVDYLDIFMDLRKSGYKNFQLINQINNSPNCSGLFGEYLDKNMWLSFDEALSRYTKYRELKIIDNKNLGVGWMDIHAKF